jgi:hypothetical protein
MRSKKDSAVIFIMMSNSFNKGSRQDPYYIVRRPLKGQGSNPQIDSGEPQIALEVFIGLRWLPSTSDRLRGVLSNTMVAQALISVT